MLLLILRRDNIETDILVSEPANHLETNSELTDILVSKSTVTKKNKRKKSSLKDHI